MLKRPASNGSDLPLALFVSALFFLVNKRPLYTYNMKELAVKQPYPRAKHSNSTVEAL